MVPTENAMPPMWNMGSPVQIRSSEGRKNRVCLVPSANRISASWLRRAPLGSLALPGGPARPGCCEVGLGGEAGRGAGAVAGAGAEHDDLVQVRGVGQVQV